MQKPEQSGARMKRGHDITMYKEIRQEYKREWAHKNKDRIKSQRQENARRKALESIESIEKLDDTHFLITDKNGNKYVIGNKEG